MPHFQIMLSNGNCAIIKHNLDATVIHNGRVVISMYDLQAGIVSGAFEFTLAKPGCESIFITNGRFDKKL